MENLWPKFGSVKGGITPREILQIQAENLNSNTKGLIKGNIDSIHLQEDVQIPFFDDPDEYIMEDTFYHKFNIHSPKLKYSFSLLSLRHATISLYPCKMISEVSKVNTIIEDENQLIETLKTIFNNEQVLNSINSLILQSKSYLKKIVVPKEEIEDDLPF